MEDINKRITKLSTALKYTKPDKCEGCKFIEDHKDGEYTNYYCSLIKGSYEACINFEIEEEDINPSCPLLDPEEDSEDYNEISDQLEILVELKEARIRLQEIERIARLAFNNPDTQDINLYRAQALAKIFQIFEYNGATIGVDLSSQPDKTVYPTDNMRIEEFEEES